MLPTSIGEKLKWTTSKLQMLVARITKAFSSHWKVRPWNSFFKFDAAFAYNKQKTWEKCAREECRCVFHPKPIAPPPHRFSGPDDEDLIPSFRPRTGHQLVKLTVRTPRGESCKFSVAEDGYETAMIGMLRAGFCYLKDSRLPWSQFALLGLNNHSPELSSVCCSCLRILLRFTTSRIESGYMCRSLGVFDSPVFDCRLVSQVLDCNIPCGSQLGLQALILSIFLSILWLQS